MTAPLTVTREQWQQLTTPQTDDNGTIIYAIQNGVCADCRTPGATPWPGEHIPYCDKCKQEQEQRWVHL